MSKPDLAAFRAFLLDQKTCVTRVTCVTASKNSDLAGYAAPEPCVTRVTGPDMRPAPESVPNEAEVLERQAMAEIEGGVPPLYSEAFARLQLTSPAGLSVSRWLQVVDDAGLFLDTFGAQAAGLGWNADNLFGPGGLIRALEGTRVAALSRGSARLSDGRTFVLFG
jgi:hypothetical protein